MTSLQIKLLLGLLVLLFIVGFIYTKRFKSEEVIIPSFLPAPTLLPTNSPITATPSARVR